MDDYIAAKRKEECIMGKYAKKKIAVSAMSDSGLDVDVYFREHMKKEVSASYTVEASFVMAIALFFIAALLTGVFEVHGRITGRFVLQDAMERCMYREEKSLRGDGMTVDEISGRAGQYLKGFFRCDDAVLTIREKGRNLNGTVKSNTETEISMHAREPEQAIRLLTALESGMEEAGWKFDIAGK